MFAVFYLPDFPLQAVLHTLPPVDREAPAIVVGGMGGRSLVAACNAAARRLSIDNGMTTAWAVARCPRLRVLLQNASAEALARRTLLSAVLDLSPRVEESVPGICTIDLRGRELEVRSLERLLEGVHGALAERGLTACAGAGATPDFALWAARSASASEPVRIPAGRERFLQSVRPEQAGFPEALLAVLHDWGIATMGDFAALPRQAVVERLGVEGGRWWDAAHGRGIRPLRLLRPPERYEESFEWEGPVESLEPLLFVLRRLLEPLCGRLRQRAMAAWRVHLRLGLENRGEYVRRFRLPEATANAETIYRMLHTHLEQVRTDDSMTSVTLRLDSAPCAVRQRGLFDTAVRNPWRFSETLARITGAVGSERVGSPRVEESYRPDAWVMEEVTGSLVAQCLPGVGDGSGSAGSQAAHCANPGIGWRRESTGEEDDDIPVRTGLPLRRLRPPDPACVRLRSGVPTGVVAHSCDAEVLAVRGPWCGSGHWWEERSWERQEWDVQLACGRLCRLLREGEGWYVEGFYG